MKISAAPTCSGAKRHLTGPFCERTWRIYSLLMDALDPVPNLTQLHGQPGLRLALRNAGAYPRKVRADLGGTVGKYKFNNPMDPSFFRFTGSTAESIKRKASDFRTSLRSSQ